MTKSNRNFNPLCGLTKTETIIGKMLCLLLVATVLSSCSAQKQERDWNDMYEVRQYQVQTITNEIVTTVFISRCVETNKVLKVEKEEVDFGGYEFERLNPFDSRGHWKVAPVIKQNLTTPEFQCVDGSCGLDK